MVISLSTAEKFLKSFHQELSFLCSGNDAIDAYGSDT